MTELQLFNTLMWGFAVTAGVVCVTLLLMTAPYGRHTRAGWGPSMGIRSGWVLMEIPTVLVFGACFVMGNRWTNPAAIAFLCVWLSHYGYRSLIYPFRLRGPSKQIPVTVVAMGALFNVANGYLNGRWLNTLGPPLDVGWLWDPRFIGGLALFVVGLVVNRQSDRILMNLRAPGETGYKIPVGGLYRWVSCPNYLGESVQWFGWALLTWSLPGLLFALWTLANLAPRAISHHRWYQKTFSDYPVDRRAFIPRLL